MAKRLQYMDALGPTIEKARFAAAGGDVAAEEARLMDPNYIAPGVMEKSTGTLQPYTPTMRENTESKIAGALESIGMSKQSARDSAIGFTGTTDASRGGMGVGVLDFAAPFSIPTAVQEASREVDRLGNDPNASGVDYIMPAITVGLSVAESLPLAKLATRPLKDFISNLAKKSGDFQSDTTTRSVSEIVDDMSPEVREQYELIRANRFLSDNQRRRTNPNPYRFPAAIPRADEPLIASAGPSISRRKVLKGMAALPAAGALSKLPLGKVDEVANVAKVAKALPNNFSIAMLKNFRKGVNAAKSSLRREYADYDPEAIPDLIQEMDEMSVDDMLIERIDTGDINPEDLVQEIKSKYPNASSDEIAKLFPEESISKKAIELIDADSTFVEVPMTKGDFNPEEKQSIIFKNKKDVSEKLNSLKEKYPNIEFITGYEKTPYKETTGHKIFYKKDNKDLVTPENRAENEMSDFTIDMKNFIPSEKAPK